MYFFRDVFFIHSFFSDTEKFYEMMIRQHVGNNVLILSWMLIWKKGCRDWTYHGVALLRWGALSAPVADRTVPRVFNEIFVDFFGVGGGRPRPLRPHLYRHHHARVFHFAFPLPYLRGRCRSRRGDRRRRPRCHLLRSVRWVHLFVTMRRT